MMYRQRRRNRQTSMPEVSLTPLIDTALVLLVIFMVASPMMHNAIKVDLPKGHAQEAQGITQELTVYIDKKEHIFLNGEPIKFDQLVTALEAKIGSAKDQKVFVNGDQGISYGALVKVVDHIKYAAGVEHVVLSTEKA